VSDSSTPVLSWSVGLGADDGAIAGEPEGVRRKRVAKGRRGVGGESVSATTLDVLALGAHLFAREAGDEPGVPVAIHARPPEYGAPIEWGAAGSIGQSWTTVPLAQSYDHPVIVAKPVVDSGSRPFSVRVRNVSARAFEVRCEPWSVGDHCADVRVSYLVAEDGRHDLAGLEYRAGTLETDRRLSDGWQEVAIGGPFTQVPAVLAGLQTDRNPGVRARIHNRNADWFDVGLESRGDGDRALVPETVGWIAVEPGTVTTSDGRRVEVFTDFAGDSPSAGRRPRAGKRPPATPSAAPEAKTARVTIAETGSTYFEEPTLVYHESAGSSARMVLVPGGEQANVAEDVCVLRAD